MAPYSTYWHFLGLPLFAIGLVLAYVAWGGTPAKRMSSTIVSSIVAALLGMVGTFVLMNCIGFLCEVLNPTEGGLGTQLFYLSFLVSPITGLLIGVVATWKAKRQGGKS